MPKKEKKMSGRSFALTIILGVFIAIMVVTLFNLLVSYVYEAPKYEDYCNNSLYSESTNPKAYPGPFGSTCLANCTFDKALDAQAQSCYSERGTPVYEYNNYGCATSLKDCNYCQKSFEDATKHYNRNVFFVFAGIGFILILVGLFVGILLIQIITLPAGAVLVIESAARNFDDKLYVIIVFSLLIIAAVILALKKLK